MNLPTVLSCLGILMAIAGACIATMNGDYLWTAVYAFLGVVAVLTLRRALSWEEPEDEDEDEDEEPREMIGA